LSGVLSAFSVGNDDLDLNQNMNYITKTVSRKKSYIFYENYEIICILNTSLFDTWSEAFRNYTESTQNTSLKNVNKVRVRLPHIAPHLHIPPSAAMSQIGTTFSLGRSRPSPHTQTLTCATINQHVPLVCHLNGLQSM